MLKLVNVSKKYKHKIAVHDICLELKKGDSLGLIGSNGAGKSTTISMIATLIKPDEGQILFEDKDIVKNPNCIRTKLGYVPQDIALYEQLSGMDNLIFWGSAYGLNGSELKNAMKTVQDIIGFTKEELKQRVCTYSGGMKRRLNIGVAILHKPELVLMDEPTVGIDIISRNQILEAIQIINKEGVSIIYTGHYLEEIEKICNKLCILHKGSIVLQGRKEELLSRTKNNSMEQLYIDAIT